MRLQEINLKNFRGIDNLRLTLDSKKPLVITGPNGSGKSSILYALECWMTGNNPVTGKTSLAGLAKRGATRSEISVITDDLGEVTRTLLPSHNLIIEGAGKLKIGKAQAELDKVTGADSDEIAYCLRGGSFLAKDQKDQNAKWWQWLGIRIDEDAIRKALDEEPLPLIKTLEELEIRIGRDLGRLHKSVYDERTIKNRELKNGKIDLATLQEQCEDGEPEEPRPVHEHLENLRIEQRELLRKLGAAESLDQRIAELEAIVSAAPTPEKVAQGQARLDALNQDLARGEAIVARVRELKKIASNPTCTSCNRPFDSHGIEAAKTELASLKAPDMVEIHRRLQIGEDWLKKAHYANEARTQLEGLRGSSILADGLTSATISEWLQSVESTLTEMERVEALWANHDQRQARLTELNGKLRKVESMIECLNKLVLLTDDKPGGIKTKILGEHTAKINEQLSSILSNWGMSARLTDVCSIEVEKDGQWRDAAVLSDGEGLLVSLALQVWLCEHTGLRILVMDRVEALDTDNRALLIAACEQLLEVEAIDHAILCGVGIDYPGAVVLGQELLEVAA